MPVNQEMLKTAQQLIVKSAGNDHKLHKMLQNWEQQGGSQSAYPMSANSKVSPAALPEDLAKALGQYYDYPKEVVPDEYEAALALLNFEDAHPAKARGAVQQQKKLALDLSPYVPGASLGAGAGALIGGVGGALFPGKKKRRFMGALRGALAGAGVGGLAGGALSAYRPDVISDTYTRLGKFLSGVKDDPKITALNKQLKREGTENLIKDQMQLPARGEEANWAKTEDVKPTPVPSKPLEPVVAIPDKPDYTSKVSPPDFGAEDSHKRFKEHEKEDRPRQLKPVPPKPVKDQPEQRDETYARGSLPKKAPGNLDGNPLYEGGVTPEMIERYRSKVPNAASMLDSELAKLLRDYMRKNPYNRATGAEGDQAGDGRGGFYPKFFNRPAFEE